MSRRGFAAGLYTAQDTENNVLPPEDDVEILDQLSFGSDFGLWTTPGSNDPAGGSWSRTNTRTGLSQATGPAGGSFAVTLIATDGQFYGFVESSGPGTETFFSIESPVIDASLGLCFLTFNLFMRFGANGVLTDGTLRVQGWNGSAWSNIGDPIVGSQQQDQTDAYLPSVSIDDYDSAGFTNDDFRFRFLFERGTSPDTFNYDCAIDTLIISGPTGAIADPVPDPPDPPNQPNGIFAQLSGEDGVNAYTGLGWNLNYPNPEQSHNRRNNTSNPAPFAGSRSLLTEVRASDNPSFVDTGSASGKRRAEISGRPGVGLYADNTEGWLGFALYLPSNPMANIRGCIVMQLHSFNEQMLNISLFAGALTVGSDGPSSNAKLLTLSLVNDNMLDRWIRFRTNFLPTPNSNGFIKVWLDDDPEGSPSVDYTGRTSPRGPYFKMGPYWWGRNSTPPDNTTTFAVTLHDNIRLGNASSDFASVDPFLFTRND